MQDERLTLIGQTADDLPAISALLQDATLRTPDIGFDRSHHRLALLVNRYRWEAATASRVRAALRIDAVLAVQRKQWPRDPEAVLALLALQLDGDWLQIDFSGGAALRVHIEVPELVLEDLAAPWPTTRIPRHS